MRVVRSGSGLLRFAIACAGLLGLLLAVDALAMFMFLLLAALASGSPMNPYAGLVAFLIIPALAAVGLGAAWGAYYAWEATKPPRAEVPAASVVARS